MTNDEPAPPGAELDRTVAEALGWHTVAYGEGRRPTWTLADPDGLERSNWPSEEAAWSRECPAFSSDTNWSGLRLLVGRMEEWGYYYCLGDHMAEGKHSAVFYDDPGGPMRWAHADTLPQATCLAALRALAGGRDGD